MGELEEFQREFLRALAEEPDAAAVRERLLRATWSDGLRRSIDRMDERMLDTAAKVARRWARRG